MLINAQIKCQLKKIDTDVNARCLAPIVADEEQNYENDIGEEHPVVAVKLEVHAYFYYLVNYTQNEHWQDAKNAHFVQLEFGGLFDFFF